MGGESITARALTHLQTRARSGSCPRSRSVRLDLNENDPRGCASRLAVFPAGCATSLSKRDGGTNPTHPPTLVPFRILDVDRQIDSLRPCRPADQESKLSLTPPSLTAAVNSCLLVTSPVTVLKKEAWLCRLRSTIPRTKLTRPPIAHKLLVVCVLCLLSYHLPSTLGPSATVRVVLV